MIITQCFQLNSIIYYGICTYITEYDIYCDISDIHFTKKKKISDLKTDYVLIRF